MEEIRARIRAGRLSGPPRPMSAPQSPAGPGKRLPKRTDHHGLSAGRVRAGCGPIATRGTQHPHGRAGSLEGRAGRHSRSSTRGGRGLGRSRGKHPGCARSRPGIGRTGPGRAGHIGVRSGSNRPSGPAPLSPHPHGVPPPAAMSRVLATRAVAWDAFAVDGTVADSTTLGPEGTEHSQQQQCGAQLCSEGRAGAITSWCLWRHGGRRAGCPAPGVAPSPSRSLRLCASGTGNEMGGQSMMGMI